MFSADLIARVHAQLQAGIQAPDIARIEGVPVEDVIAIRSAILDDYRVADCNRPVEEVWVEYLTRTRANIAQMDEVIPELREHKQGVAVVGAIKAKQGFLDQAMKVGQDLGFIRRVPVRHEVFALTANLTSHEMRELATAEIQRIQALVATDGDLLDMDAPALPLPQATGGDLMVPAPAPGESRAVRRRAVARKTTVAAHADRREAVR